MAPAIKRQRLRSRVEATPAPPLVLQLIEAVLAIGAVAIELAERQNLDVERGHQYGVFPDLAAVVDLGKAEPQLAIAVALGLVMALVVWGLLWAWHRIKRYRLAFGFAGLTAGFGIIRFISLHEVDAWNAAVPWARTAVDLVAAAGVSTVAIARLCQLRNFCGLAMSDPTGGR